MSTTLMTWKDIKLATLQKMFAADGNTIPTDESTSDYIAGMPYVANEALQMISTAGKFLIKKISIANYPVNNILEDIGIIQMTGTEEFTADNGKSYAFSVHGVGKCSVYIGDALFKEIDIPKTTGFIVCKGLIPNVEDKAIKLVFETEYIMTIKDIAVYGISFETVDDIPEYTEYIRYDMDELVDDFFMLDVQPIVYEGDRTTKYLKSSDYRTEGQSFILFPRESAGNYTVYYKAYPKEFTSATSDSYILPVYPEVAALMPLYMASQLYKDDDNGIATTYRNEFEVAFDRLSQRSESPSSELFESESGWI